MLFVHIVEEFGIEHAILYFSIFEYLDFFLFGEAQVANWNFFVLVPGSVVFLAAALVAEEMSASVAHDLISLEENFLEEVRVRCLFVFHVRVS